MSERVLEIGAGINPEIDGSQGETLDIRTDLEHIDFPGVDIAVDEWPIESETYDRVIMKHVLEHLPPSRMTHVFTELDRVLKPGGTAEIELPHAGTYGAATDLTHTGTGGTTADVCEYFDGRLEDYWPDLNWAVDSWAEIEFPVFSSYTFDTRVYSGLLSMQLVKIPLVTGTVHIRIRLW